MSPVRPSPPRSAFLALAPVTVGGSDDGEVQHPVQPARQLEGLALRRRPRRQRGADRLELLQSPTRPRRPDHRHHDAFRRLTGSVVGYGLRHRECADHDRRHSDSGPNQSGPKSSVTFTVKRVEAGTTNPYWNGSAFVATPFEFTAPVTGGATWSTPFTYPTGGKYEIAAKVFDLTNVRFGATRPRRWTSTTRSRTRSSSRRRRATIPTTASARRRPP